MRALGVRQLAASIFNYTVGSGIFALPALAVAQLGSGAPLAYLVCALVMGCVCTTTLMAATTAMIANIRNRMTSIYFVVQATRKPVTSKFNIATGKRNFHVKPISWS